MFASDETDVIEQITRFWLNDEQNQNEKIATDARSVLGKIEKQHIHSRIYEQEGPDKANEYYEQHKPLGRFEEEMETIDKIAQYWLEHAKEQDKETKAFVNKIRMKIEMWRFTKGQEYYEKHELLGMFEEEELKVLRKALTGFIDAKAHPKEDIKIAESILERLEEP